MIHKGQWPVIIFNIIVLVTAFFGYSYMGNLEFLLYSGALILIFIFIVFTNKWLNYPLYILWGLSLMGLIHMMGGIKFGDVVLYDILIIPLTQNTIRYDQILHFVGFAFVTLTIYYMLKPKGNWWIVSVIIVMAGLGAGAFNEMIEFLATTIYPPHTVGGYVNTSLDLVADFLGAVVAMIYIRLKNGEVDKL